MANTKNKGKGKAKAKVKGKDKDKDKNNKEAEDKAHQAEPTQQSAEEEFADKGFDIRIDTAELLSKSFVEPRFNSNGSVYLVARQDFRLGDVIIRERPMTRLDRPPKPSAEDIALLRRELSVWEPMSRIMFFMLPNAWPLLDRVYSIFYTYSAHITLSHTAETQKGKGKPLYFFLITSFLEHSCHPNTTEIWDIEHNMVKKTLSDGGSGDDENETVGSKENRGILDRPPDNPWTPVFSPLFATLTDTWYFPSLDDLPFEAEEPPDSDWVMLQGTETKPVLTPRKRWFFLGEIINIRIVRPLKVDVADRWGTPATVTFFTPLDGYEFMSRLRGSKNHTITIQYAFRRHQGDNPDCIAVYDKRQVDFMQMDI
ncbi:hypothetical protein N3K66_006428 [Trichothecium roseum]|uniref:Uncharacterized protein n=1 Tax=Trichothecium roseum TaxID=47278 RepID=A0ACC0UXW4_9HYPO|nr:hypothetical protein N3K66_006428 [Trichothecium roseum]